MSDSSLQTATGGDGTGAEPAGPTSPLARAAGVFYAPVSTFRSLAARFSWADWAVPVLICLLATIALFTLVAPHLDITAQTRDSMEAAGMAPEQIDAAVERQEQFFAGPLRHVFIVVQGLAYAGFLALLALFFWGGASAFGGSITYGKTLAVVGYASLVRILEGVLLLLVVQGREPIRADRIVSVLATNPASYLSVEQADTVLYAVVSSLNLFTLWVMGLIALGLSEAGRMSRGAAFGLVGLLFGLWLALVAGWAAIF